MQTRQFLQRLFPFIKRANAESKLAQPPDKTTHTYPLSPPTHHGSVARVGRYRRVRIPRNPPVTDPRFNHALRPSHIARAASKLTPIANDSL